MMGAAEIHALKKAALRINFPDPGFQWQVDGTLGTVVQCDADATISVSIIVYTSQQNAKGTVNNTLNDALPKAYRRNP